MKQRKKHKNHSVSFLSVLLIAGVGVLVAAFSLRLLRLTPPGPQQEKRIQEEAVKPLSQPFEILLVGTDNTAEEKGSSRSDAILIGSLDPDSNKIRLVSILRDCYAAIPGHDTHRINEAFALGGAELLLETVNQSFGLEIQNYIQVDFSTFSQIVDILGGVDIPVTEAEAPHVFGEGRAAGTYHLTGGQALNYCRIRKIDNDFNRTQRQRNLLTSVYRTFSREGEDKLLTLFWEMVPHIKTNLDTADMVTLLKQYRLLQDVTLDQMSIPVADGFEEKAVYGQDVLLLDMEANIQAIHRYLYGSGAAIPAARQLPEIPASAIGDPSWLAGPAKAAGGGLEPKGGIFPCRRGGTGLGGR